MKKFDLMIDEFMVYCDSKNLSKKTMMSYEQTLRLFSKFLEEKNIKEVTKVTEKEIREYINFTKERGKYTVVIDLKTLITNMPEQRQDYGKKVSITTINNYIISKKFMGLLNLLFFKNPLKIGFIFMSKVIIIQY